MKNDQVIFVQGKVQSFTSMHGYTLKQWLKDNHISFQQNYDDYYVIDDAGRRTGEVYSLLNVIPTDDPRTI